MVTDDTIVAVATPAGPGAVSMIRVSGPDAATYLQSQVSQDVRSLGIGSSTWAFLLQPTGKVDALAPQSLHL